MTSVLLQKLHFIESIFDEFDFLNGEELVDTSDGMPPIKKSRSTYTITVPDRKITIKLKKGELSFESEPPLPKGKSKGEYVYAGIMLRKYLTLEEEKAKQAAPKRKKSVNSPLSSLLREIPHQQLILFIQSYSKKDPHFSARLQANFISKYGNDDEKYADLLSKVVKPKSEKSPKLAQKDLQTTLAILDNFNAQAEDLYSLGKYRELSKILIAALKKIAYIRNTYKISNKRIDTLNENLVDLLRRTCKQNLAPEFSEQLLAQIVSIVELSYYLPEQDTLSRSLYEIVSAHKLTTQEQIIDIVEDLKLKSGRVERFLKPQVLCTALLIGSRSPEALKKVHSKWESTEIVPAINMLLNEKFFDAVDANLELLRDNTDLHKEIALLQAERYLNSKDDKKAIKHYLIWASHKPKIFELVKRMQRLDPEVTDKNSAKLKKAIKDYPPSDQLYIYNGLGLTDLLIECLEENQDMDYMQQYDRDLVEEDSDFVQAFYTKWVETYLSEHFGTKSVDTVENYLHHLNSIGLKKFSATLRKTVKSLFNSRKSVSEHI